MNLADGRLSPAPGNDGLVTRVPGALLFVAARTPVDDVTQLIEAVRDAGSDSPGRQLARRMAVLVGSDHDTTLPGFALVASTPDGIYVRAYGPVEVHLLGDSGDEVISAVGSLTGVDREVTGPFHTIAAHRASDPMPAPSFDVDLESGTVPGSGFSVTTLAGPTDAQAAAPTAVDEPTADTDGGAEADEAPAGMPAGAAGAAVGAVGAVGVAAMASSADEPPADAPSDAGWTEEPTQAWSPSTDDLDPDPGGTGEPVPDEPMPGAAPLDPMSEPVPDEPMPGAAPLDPMSEPVPDAVPDDSIAATPPPLDAPPPLDPSPVDAPPPLDAAMADDIPAEAGDDHVHDHSHEPATLGLSELPAAEPGAADAPAAAFTSVLLGALDNDEVDERDALPVELDPADVRAPDQPEAEEVLVQGVVCSRGHFNDPRSRFCSSCGISMVQNTQVLTQGPRPPLGVMVFEDGATFSLSTDYVVGRQPEVHELVQQSLALPITVDDPERSISRAHAELRLVDWDVHLVNLSGTNGSFVWDETSQQWIPIPEGQSVQLMPGMRVALGRRSAVFESSLVR